MVQLKLVRPVLEEPVAGMHSWCHRLMTGTSPTGGTGGFCPACRVELAWEEELEEGMLQRVQMENKRAKAELQDCVKQGTVSSARFHVRFFFLQRCIPCMLRRNDGRVGTTFALCMTLEVWPELSTCLDSCTFQCLILNARGSRTHSCRSKCMPLFGQVVHSLTPCELRVARHNQSLLCSLPTRPTTPDSFGT